MSATNIQQGKKCLATCCSGSYSSNSTLSMICRLQRSFVCFVFLFSVALVLKQYGSCCQSNIDTNTLPHRSFPSFFNDSKNLQHIKNR